MFSKDQLNQLRELIREENEPIKRQLDTQGKDIAGLKQDVSGLKQNVERVELKVEAINHKLDTAVMEIKETIERGFEEAGDKFSDTFEKLDKQDKFEERLERIEKHLDLPQL